MLKSFLENLHVRDRIVMISFSSKLLYHTLFCILYYSLSYLRSLFIVEQSVEVIVQQQEGDHAGAH